MPVPVFTAPAESRAHAAEGAYPLEFLPRKADNYMNSTFANLPRHQRMEARTAGVLEMHADRCSGAVRLRPAMRLRCSTSVGAWR